MFFLGLLFSNPINANSPNTSISLLCIRWSTEDHYHRGWIQEESVEGSWGIPGEVLLFIIYLQPAIFSSCSLAGVKGFRAHPWQVSPCHPQVTRRGEDPGIHHTTGRKKINYKKKKMRVRLHGNLQPAELFTQKLNQSIITVRRGVYGIINGSSEKEKLNKAFCKAYFWWAWLTKVMWPTRGYHIFK